MTVIEVLSPSNKTAGTPGQDLYLTQQRECLRSQTHLIEFDFLHYGEHIIAPARERLLEQGTWDYPVSLHRGGQGSRYGVWAVTLRQRCHASVFLWLRIPPTLCQTYKRSLSAATKPLPTLVDLTITVTQRYL